MNKHMNHGDEYDYTGSGDCILVFFKWWVDLYQSSVVSNTIAVLSSEKYPWSLRELWYSSIKLYTGETVLIKISWHAINIIFTFNSTSNANHILYRLTITTQTWLILVAGYEEILCLFYTWWCHQMEIFSALLAICAGNSPVTGEFHAQRPVTRSFDVFFDPRPNKRLSKQWRGWWFETPSSPLWRHCNAFGWIVCMDINFILPLQMGPPS